MVEEYRSLSEIAWPADVAYYMKQPSLRDAISKAGRALTKDGKRHSHQSRYRFPDAVLGQWREVLIAAEAEIFRCKTFEELHQLFWEIRSPGIGKLTVYDTALRVGSKMGTFPDRVYMHAGVIEGVKALGLDSTRPTIRVEEFPIEVQTLEPYEVEDFLCIYKSELAGGRAPSQVCGKKIDSRLRLC